MKLQMSKTTLLGDLVVSAFDKAARNSNNPREVARMATLAVTQMLRHARRPTMVRIAPVLSP